jgi:hypothetical protein
MARKGMTQFEALNHYSAVIKTASTHPEIFSKLEEFGYDSVQLGKGKNLLENTVSAYDNSKKESMELKEASEKFKYIRDSIADTFSKHRRLAQVIYRGNVSVTNKLEIYKRNSRVYSEWLEHMIRFYDISIEDIEIQNGLKRFRIEIGDLQEMRDKIDEMIEQKRKCDIENSEKQSATQYKTKCFEELDLWMSDFNKVASIIFEDDPQILEALGRTVP